MSAYAELHCLSNFSFQRGASSAQELFERARRLGYRDLRLDTNRALPEAIALYHATGWTEVAPYTDFPATHWFGKAL